MILRTTILALLLLATTAGAAEVVVYSLPAGLNRNKLEKKIDAALEEAGLLGAITGSGRTPITWQLTLGVEATEALLAKLDAAIERGYEAYRREALAELPEHLALQRPELELARKRASEVRAEMEAIFKSGKGVLDRERTLAAIAERIEELRRRTVDARIELAVAKALAAAREKAISHRISKIDAARDADIAKRKKALEDAGYGPGHPLFLEFRNYAEKVRMTPIDDEQVSTLRNKLAGVVIEQLALEERIKALDLALTEERERGMKVLSAVDLTEFRRGVDVADEEVADVRRRIERLEKELAALKSDAKPTRQTKVKRR